MRRLGILLVLCFAVLSVSGCCAVERKSPKGITAILGAFDLELNVIRQEAINQKTEKVMGLKFVTGEIQGRKVVFAETGIGKVHSAMATAMVIDHFKPKEVIFTGVAGAINPDLKGGDIVIAEKTAQHDLIFLGAGGSEPYKVDNPVTGDGYPGYYTADMRLFRYAKAAAGDVEYGKVGSGENIRVPKVITGIIVSGDMFVSNSEKNKFLRDYYNADAVEMEGAVVAQICYQQGVPCVVIRSVSDGADENADNDFEQYVATAADNSAKIVVKMLELMQRD